MTIYAAGINESFQIANNLNNPVSPPSILRLDLKILKSYSIFHNFAVAVLTDGTPIAIGNNMGWPIYERLPKIINNWTTFNVGTRNNTYRVESAVCGLDYTLYMLEHSNSNTPPLAYVKKGQMKGRPIFLNTDGWRIVAIYGGQNTAAAIDERGAIHIIDKSLSINDNQTKMIFLPSPNLPVSIAFEGDAIIAISSLGNIFNFDISDFGDEAEFYFIEELEDVFITYIAGTADHSIAVSSDGDVFVRGSNEYDQLGIGRNTVRCDQYVRLLSLRNQEIIQAFAGAYHSIFMNSNGKLLSCGSSDNGEALQRSFIRNITQPTSTIIDNDAFFCIAGSCLSIAFVGCNPPPYSPNQKLELKNQCPYPLMFSDYIDSEIQNLKDENGQLQSKVDSQRQELRNLNVKNSQLQNDILYFRTTCNKYEQYQKNMVFQQQEIARLKIENLQLKNMNNKSDQYQQEITRLTNENMQLKTICKNNDQLQKNITLQQNEIIRLKNENEVIKKMSTERSKLMKTINSQNEEIDKLKKEIESLKAQAISSKNENFAETDQKNVTDSQEDEEDFDNDYDDNFEDYIDNNK